MSNNRKKEDITCIQLSKETRDLLAEMGGKRDRYEDIIKALIDFKSPTGEDRVQDVVESED